jgi:hypothetical protein
MIPVRLFERHQKVLAFFREQEAKLKKPIVFMEEGEKNIRHDFSSNDEFWRIDGENLDPQQRTDERMGITSSGGGGPC